MILPNSLSENRFYESLGSCFVQNDPLTTDVLFLLSPDDHGVARNFGRKGARFAPEVIINQLKKCSLPSLGNKKISFAAIAVFERDLTYDYEENIQHQTQLIENILVKTKAKKIIHLGGGHDQIYPFVKAIQATQSQKVSILNIDAHADTRDEKNLHSGTPFRELAKENLIDNIFQFGLHPFANTPSSQNALPNTNEYKLWFQECFSKNKKDEFLQALKKSSTNLILSLDADAINSGVMPGVSAVNHQGLEIEQVLSLINLYQETIKNDEQTEYYGIYEYNPLYDTLSNQGARSLVRIIWEICF